jgi:hypothetical protein
MAPASDSGLMADGFMAIPPSSPGFNNAGLSFDNVPDDFETTRLPPQSPALT